MNISSNLRNGLWSQFVTDIKEHGQKPEEAFKRAMSAAYSYGFDESPAHSAAVLQTINNGLTAHCIKLQTVRGASKALWAALRGKAIVIPSVVSLPVNQE